MIANALDDSESSDAGSVSSKTSSSAATVQTVVSAPAVMDECKEKGLCYRYQRGTCKKGAKCPYKHEKCSTPLPDGWSKRGRKEKDKGKSRSPSPERKLDPRTAEAKAQVPCRHFAKGKYTKGDQCQYKH